MKNDSDAAIEPLLTFKQAADFWGISLRQFYRIVADGGVSVVRIGERSPRVSPSEIRRYLECHTENYGKPDKCA
jgi:excisionase family DNA binding protein